MTGKKVRRDFFAPLTDPRIDARTGFLRTTANIARIGVQDYYEDGQLIREFRSPEEVAKSVSSFDLLPVTLDHPSEGMIDVSNRKELDVGTTGTPRFEDGWVKADIVIRDKDAIVKAQTTHKELSAGYEATVLDRAGMFVDVNGVQGEPGKVYLYDRVQTGILPNHSAIVPQARAGAKARLDSEVSMKEVSISGKTYQIPDKVADALVAQQTKVDELTSKLRTDAEEMEEQVNVSSPELANPEEEEEMDMKKKGDGIKFADRLKAYNDAKPYLDGARFDGSVPPHGWYLVALDANGHENISEGEAKEAFDMLLAPTATKRDSGKFNRDFLKRVNSDRTDARQSDIDPRFQHVKECLDAVEARTKQVSDQWKTLPAHMQMEAV